MTAPEHLSRRWSKSSDTSCRYMHLDSLRSIQPLETQPSQLACPHRMPLLPVSFGSSAEYHVAANQAFAHLLNRIAADERLSHGEYLLAELLRHSLNLQEPAMSADIASAMIIRGTLLLLDRIHERADLSLGDYQLADALLGAVRAQGRALRKETRQAH